MSNARRYPRLNLRSKNEIAKRISSNYLPPKATLSLLNDVLKNFDSYWYDSKMSESEKGKFVRSAAKSPQLEKLLDLINERILTPYDSIVPGFFFGGLSGRNNAQAAHHLLGKKRGRILLKLDVKGFFEKISEQRVFYFFYKKCSCSAKAAEILAKLCCVPSGPKGSGSSEKILARGFATSPRLALWCNADTFQRLDWKIKEKLKNYDPRIAIYVDDIGITASRATKEQMETTKDLAIKILEEKDKNQPLPIHKEGKKLKIIKLADGAEHLGVKLGRNKLAVGGKTRSRMDKIKLSIKNSKNHEEKRVLIVKYKAYQRYKKQVEKLNKL